MSTTPQTHVGRRATASVLTLARLAGRDELLLLGTAMAFILIAALLSALSPLLLKYLVDQLGGETGETVSKIAALPPAWLLGLYLAALGLSRLANEGRTLLFGMADQSLERRISRHAFSHIMALPLRTHHSRPTGELLQTLENGLQGFRLLLQHILVTFLPGLLELAIIALVVAGLFDWPFLLVFAASAAAYLTVFSLGARQILSSSRKVSAARIGASAGLADSLLNTEAVKGAGGEAATVHLQDERLAAVQQAWRAFYRTRFLNGFCVAAIFAASLGLVLWLALRGVAAGDMTAGDFVLVNLYMIQLVQPLERLGYGLRDIGQGAAFLERLLGLLREPAEPAYGAAGSRPGSARRPARVTVRQVSFSHAQGHKVLDQVTFDLAPGTFTALVGPSGSGKSTLLRLLMRFYEPGEGDILMDGIPLAGIPQPDLRRQIAFIPQDVTLFNESLAFNIAFPDEAGANPELERAVERAALSEFVKVLPDGLSTLVGERGLRLSGGERQRIAIARSLMRAPRLLLADEPTAALDPQTEAAVARTLLARRGGLTVLVIAHRLTSIAGADQILVLEKGRIVERGHHEALLVQGGLYAQLWKDQGRGHGK